jgi:type IV pilus assembly protein PilC
VPRFSYRARQTDGTLTQGVLRAANEERAASLLRSHGLTPIHIAAADAVPFWQREIGGRSLRTKDLIIFTRQTASMIRAGVPILKALQSLEQQVPRKGFRRVMKEMAYDVEAGQSLSNAMSKHTRSFNPFILGIVRTGEVSGRLNESLESISNYLEQDYAFIRKMRSALLYPVFVLVLVIIMSGIMFTYVLPQLVAIFEDAEVQLPWPTVVLIAITNFLQSYWIGIIVFAVVMSWIIYSYLKTPEGHYTFSTYVLKTPLLSTFFQKLYLTRLTSILHTLFLSDVPVLESLALAKEAVGNRVYQRTLDDTIKAIKDGASISYAWQHEPFIPPMLTAMVGVGERSGEVGKAFAEASRFFQRDVESMLDAAATLLEPVLILILGVGVGIVVGAVLLPIYNLVLVL